MSEKKDEAYYVGFQDPSSIRRTILETAKASVMVLRVHGRVKQLQDEKLRVRSELAQVLHELKSDFSKLEMLLPHKDIEPPKTPHTKRHTIAEHHLDKIESALSEIERRKRTL